MELSVVESGTLWIIDNGKRYYVRYHGMHSLFVCSCPDHFFRGHDCKHIKFVQANGFDDGDAIRVVGADRLQEENDALQKRLFAYEVLISELVDVKNSD